MKPSLLLGLAGALACSTLALAVSPANATITVTLGNMTTTTGALVVNDFEGIGAAFFYGKATIADPTAKMSYSQQGLNATYIGADPGWWTTFRHEGNYSIYDGGGGTDSSYTRFSLDSGALIQGFEVDVATGYPTGINAPLSFRFEDASGTTSPWFNVGSFNQSFFQSVSFDASPGSAFKGIDLKVTLPRSTEAGVFDFAQARLAPVASVPEPASWAMLIIGFGAIGTVLRNGHRRRHLALA
ncbi:MAG: hypothetical protein JWL88_828 [Parcubacteria group bacterium]|nr:hypothetical protein [Parcubacteria group bacterium]